MKKIDFLLTYEVKRRELEYLALLKVELERRGYSIALEPANALWGWGTQYEVEVIINAGFSIQYINSGNGAKFRKALELTSEQISYEECDDKITERDELCKKVMVNAWGDAFRKQLIKKGKMPEGNIVVYGHPVMDFCKKRFNQYDLSREEIANEYSIPMDKKWNLFISSFVLGAMGERGVQKYDKKHGTTGTSRLYENETKTIETLAKWFSRFLEENQEQFVIYRPHPVEKLDKIWRELEKKYKNFRIIGNGCVRQWIKVSDRIYTWISTSSLEAYFLDKPIYMLRPHSVDRDIDISIFNHPEKAIDNYDDFMKTMSSIDKLDEFYFLDKEIEEHCYYDAHKYTYECLADLCEEMYHNEKYVLPEALLRALSRNIKKKWKSMGRKNRFRLMMRRTPFYKTYHDLFSRDVDYMNLKKGELEAIEARIKDCLF